MSSPNNNLEPVVFRSLVVERFRGFNDPVEIPLDASAVVVSGANGQGKTSFFDAIQWLLLGHIQRLEELRFRKNEEHIINRYAPIGSKARVQAIIKDASSGNWITVTRTGNYRGSILEAETNEEKLVGQKAEVLMRKALGVSTSDEDTFGQYFLSTALLQQDLVREFLSTYTHAKRYEIISRLLGLSAIDEFNDKLDETKKYIAEQIEKTYTDLQDAKQSVAEAEQDVRESKARIETAPILSETIKELENEANSLGLGFLLERMRNTSDDGEQIVLRDILRYEKQLERLDDLIITMRTHFDERPELDLVTTEKIATEIKNELNEEKSKLKDDRATEQECLETLEKVKSRTDDLRQLASLAIPMLTDHCPVCSQTIDTESVRTKLQLLLGEQPELLEARNKYKEAKEATAQRAKRISQLEEKHRDAAADTEQAKLWEKRTSHLLDDLRGISHTLETLNFPQPFPQSDALIDWLPIVQNWASGTLAKLNTFEQLVQSVIAAQSAPEESDRLNRLEAKLNLLISQYNEKRGVVDGLEQVLGKRKNLVELARKKATEVVREALDELDPVWQDLFSRLAPHPTFDRLSFSHELYHKRGASIPLAIDQQAQLEISPSIGFSSAQANVAALCYFLALAFASSEADFGFVLLDDPLQAMDDVNVLGFADLCRFLRKEKQLIIATHEGRLSNLLVRKLISRDKPINTIRLEFTSWNRSGPYIKVERTGSRPEISVLASLAVTT